MRILISLLLTMTALNTYAASDRLSFTCTHQSDVNEGMTTGFENAATLQIQIEGDIATTTTPQRVDQWALNTAWSTPESEVYSQGSAVRGSLIAFPHELLNGDTTGHAVISSWSSFRRGSSTFACSLVK